MICKYCQSIHVVDHGYPSRQATKDVQSDFPRCDWHWRFVCSVCGRPRHFNGTTWCPESERFVCIRCAKSHRVVHRSFWNWEYYYALECSICGRFHPALDYLEFTGKHPWQVHSDMENRKEGLDTATEFVRVPSDFVPFKDAVSESKISEAWSRFAHEWADGYTDQGDLNRQYVVDPVILKLAGSVKGLEILDAGCGNGYLSRLLARKGARVEGMDISRVFIDMARRNEKENPLGIEYHVGSVCNMHMFQDEIFDLVVSNLVLMDLADLDKAMEEFRRVLKNGGRLIFSVMHPCFASPPVHGWVRTPLDTDRKEDRAYWKVDKYFDEMMEIWRLTPEAPPLYSFHRPLSKYVNTVFRHGFTITGFEEPRPSRRAIERHYREFGNEYERIPWFLIMRATKQSLRSRATRLT
jgi:2-polyprenyl-3-methyl-5-hydroxy-6-metoxy-1,4-benzoquinol methylase